MRFLRRGGRSLEWMRRFLEETGRNPRCEDGMQRDPARLAKE
jgi:hypothetical protein